MICFRRKNNKWYGFILILLYLLMMCLPAWSEEATTSSVHGLYRYQTVTGPNESFFIWEKSTEGDRVVITVNDQTNDRLMVNHCRDGGETVSWLLREKKNTEIRVERNGNTLHIYGKEAGNYLDETYTIDQRPWYQPLSYSLTRFLFSEDESVSFWTIRQDTLDLVSIEAKKIGLETIVINNEEVPAIKVEIRLAGFLSPFWHATYWYREENGQFLKYSAVSGPPGSDKTMISLVGKISN